MLHAAEPVAFLPAQDLERSERFFRDQLGLPLVSRSDFAVVFRCGATTTLRVTRVDQLQPQPFTVFGWVVSDIRAEVARLREGGIDLLRYDGLGQDDDGVWATPGGDLVAWFADPDANVLSMTELAST